MDIKTTVFVSCIPVVGYRQLLGAEAKDALLEMGYTHVLVDDNGIFHALSNENKILEGYRIYAQQSVVMAELDNEDQVPSS